MNEDLESPDFDGKPFTAGEPQDDWPSRAHGWALVLVIIFGIVGFSLLRAGSVAGGVVFLAIGVVALAISALLIRKELRKFMEYRRRL